MLSNREISTTTSNPVIAKQRLTTMLYYLPSTAVYPTVSRMLGVYRSFNCVSANSHVRIRKL